MKFLHKFFFFFLNKKRFKYGIEEFIIITSPFNFILDWYLDNIQKLLYFRNDLQTYVIIKNNTYNIILSNSYLYRRFCINEHNIDYDIIHIKEKEIENLKLDNNKLTLYFNLDNVKGVKKSNEYFIVKYDTYNRTIKYKNKDCYIFNKNINEDVIKEHLKYYKELNILVAKKITSLDNIKMDILTKINSKNIKNIEVNII